VNLPRPVAGEYHPAYLRYIDRVTEADVLQALEAQIAEVRRALGAVPAERETWRYEPEKWSVRQVLGHVLDSERVFGYRMLSVARGEDQPLPGFNEDSYAAAAGHDRIPLADLLGEFELLRGSHVALAKELDDVAWARIGTANGHPIAPRALAYIMVGHPRHHLAVLASKYGIPA
jgi:hypothetical protein